MKLLLFLLFVIESLSALSTLRFDNEKVFRVEPKNEEEVRFIKYLASVMQLNFWKPHSSHHVIPNIMVDFHASAADSKSIIDLFEEKGIKFRIIFQNLQEAVENQFYRDEQVLQEHPRRPRYQTWSEIASWAYKVSIKNPKLVSFSQIGTTYEGNPIQILKIGSQKANKKGIFLECGIHAREWISPAFCQWFVNEAIKTYGKDKNMTKLLDSVTFHVIPVTNIDGYIWTWNHDRFWRKNRSPNSDKNCMGTDLNRNFNISWGTIDFYTNPCYEIYPGSGPESEKEVKELAAYIRDNLSSLKAYISFHSYGHMLMYPYGYTDKEAPNHDKLEEIAVSAVNVLSSLYGTNYSHGPIASTIYPVSGSSIDWAYSEGIKYSFVFELRDDGEYGFLLPEYLIKPTCQETMLAVKQIASYIVNLIN
ncbi:mast cell carboxypeptidase A-like [Rhinophrynus dorsalis]